MKGTIFEKVMENKMHFLFSLQILRNMLLSKKSERRIIKMYIVFHVSTRYSSQILIKFEISLQIFQKHKYQISYKSV